MTEIERACHHLMWVWRQFGPSDKIDGEIYLHHRCIKAGEDATEYLEHHGYAIDNGHSAHLTLSGRRLLEEDVE